VPLFVNKMMTVLFPPLLIVATLVLTTLSALVAGLTLTVTSGLAPSATLPSSITLRKAHVVHRPAPTLKIVNKLLPTVPIRASTTPPAVHALPTMIVILGHTLHAQHPEHSKEVALFLPVSLVKIDLVMMPFARTLASTMLFVLAVAILLVLEMSKTIAFCGHQRLTAMHRRNVRLAVTLTASVQMVGIVWTTFV